MTDMSTVTLGLIGLEVSRIAFGTWQLGGEWGEFDEQQAIAAIRQARELGVNLFDTAQGYGGWRDATGARCSRWVPAGVAVPSCCARRGRSKSRPRADDRTTPLAEHRGMTSAPVGSRRRIAIRPGPVATIVLAALVGIAGAVAVVVLDSAVADAVGVAALACGLAAVLWAALRLASDSDVSD